MNRTLPLLMLFATSAAAQQVPDTAYAPPITQATFASASGPRVLIDAAHHNFHTADGGYTAFARLLRRDGFRVGSNPAAFTRESLRAADILVIANAMHEQSTTGFAPLPNHSAFTAAEIAAVEAWVRAGGALLLIADHMPLAGHAEALAAAFGVRFHNGFAMDAGGSGTITYRRSDGSLRAHDVASGIDSVTSFMGQAFRLDPDVDAVPLLVVPAGYSVLLPRVAWEFSDATARVPADHLLQGALVHHGRGRVAVFGEAAMFTAQLAGPQRVPAGMNAPIAAQNYRFVLNFMHWLAGRG